MGTRKQSLHRCHGEGQYVFPTLGAWPIRAVVLWLGLWAAGSTLGQTLDYSAGVKKILELGLPDAHQARYIKIESQSGMWGGAPMAQGPKMTGNGWLLETKTNGAAVVLMDQLNVAELVSAKIIEQRRKALMDALAAKTKAGPTPGEEDSADAETDENGAPGMEELSRLQIGEWKEADLKTDLKSVIDYLNKAGGENDYEFKQRAVGYFLFAVHAHSRGQTVEANEIISLLFKKLGDSRKVLSAAMSRIAEAEYNKAYQAFAKSGNWAQYLSSMEGLLDRFGTVWHSAPVVERVVGMVRKHVGQSTPAPLTAEGLTEEDTRIAALLAQTNTVIVLYHPVFGGLHWLMNDRTSAGPREPKQKAPGPLDLIQQRGVKAIPLLVALLKDEGLVRIKGGNTVNYGFAEMDDEGISAEEVDQRLEFFSRPLTRGEIARRILAPLVLGPDRFGNRENQPTADELAQKSRAWYEQHKTENRSELARRLLAEGRQEPLQFLLGSPDAADRVAVESYLMNTNKLAENLPQVTQYAQRQGAAVKAFVQRYIGELTKLPSLLPKRELGGTDVRFRKQREEQAKAELKALENLVSDRTAEQVLQELTSSGKKWNAQELSRTGAVLTGKLAQEDPDQALTLLLQACLKTKDPQLAMFLLQHASSLRWAEARKPRAANAPPPRPREFKLATHAELWKQVLVQGSTNSFESPRGGDAISFQAQIASIIENFYADPKALRGGHEAGAGYLGARMFEVTLERVQARLAGKPEAELPGYPDKTKVSKERAVQIGQLLLNSTKEKQHEIAGTLSLDEILVLPELVAADAKLNEKLVPGSHVIQKTRLNLTNAALARVCLPAKNRTLDTNLIGSLIAECKKLAELGSNLTVTVERRVPLAGVSLTVRTNPANPGRMFGYSGARRGGGPQAQLSAMLQAEGANGVHGYVQWPIKLAVAPKPEAKSTESAQPADDDLLPENQAGRRDLIKRQEEEFWTNFEKLFEPARDACQPYVCTLSVQCSNPMEEE